MSALQAERLMTERGKSQPIRCTIVPTNSPGAEERIVKAIKILLKAAARKERAA